MPNKPMNLNWDDLLNLFPKFEPGAGLDGTALQLTRQDGEPIGVPVTDTQHEDLRALSAYRHAYYAVPDIEEHADSDGPLDEQVIARDGNRTTDLNEANLFSSELVDADGNPTGYHTIALDIDLPVRVRPTSTPGHYHLHIDKPMKWEQYQTLIDLLVELDIVEPGYAAASLARKATHLRLPWIQKEVVHHPDGKTVYRLAGEEVTRKEYWDEQKRRNEERHAVERQEYARRILNGEAHSPFDADQYVPQQVDGQTVFRKPKEGPNA